MNRSHWIIAVALVFVGLSCLVTAAIGYTANPMAAMMFWMPMSIYFPAFICLLILLAVLFFAYVIMKQNHLRCPRCNTSVRPDWRVCPHCGSALKE